VVVYALGPETVGVGLACRTQASLCSSSASIICSASDNGVNASFSPWTSSVPVRPGTVPGPVVQRGSAMGSTASNSIRTGPSVNPCAFQPRISCSNAGARRMPSSSACSVNTCPAGAADASRVR